MIRSHVTRNDDPPDEPTLPCECCGRDSADCICPQCPVCGETGNPACYLPVQGTFGPIGPSLFYTIDQRLGVLEAKFAQLKDTLDNLLYMIQPPPLGPTPPGGYPVDPPEDKSK